MQILQQSQKKIDDLSEKYHNLSMPLKATVWLTLCQFLQKAMSILTTPFITRMLSTDEYGKINTFTSWENIFLILITFSSAHAVMNLCVKYEDRNKVLSSLIGYDLFLAFIWGGILFFSFETIRKFTGMSGFLIVCLYLFCVFQSIIYCWIYFRQYEYDYKIIVLQSLIYNFGVLFGGLFMIAFVSKTAEAYIFSRAISAVVIGMVITISVLNKNRTFYDSSVWKFSFGFCVPLLPHYLSEIVLLSSDRIMIDRMCGSSDVAIYSMAYSVGLLITMITNAVNSAFAPYQYQMIKDKKFTILAKNSNYVIGFIAVALCGIMLFGQEVVFIFGGIKYAESVSLIIPISLGVFFNYVFQLFARVQEYFEQKYTITIASVCCAFLNIGLNYIFISLCGYKAAAYTTFICYLVFCFLHYVFYRKVCKKYIGQEIYDRSKLLWISFALIAVTMVIRLISDIYILKYLMMMFILILILWKKKRILEFIKMMKEKE